MDLVFLHQGAEIRSRNRNLYHRGAAASPLETREVFVWAEKYAKSDPRYQSLTPFSSADLDLIGDRDDAAAIGRALKANTRLKPGHDPSPNAGVVRFRDSRGRELRIDILTGVLGADYAEAFATAHLFSLPNGAKIKVLDPYLCLQNKITNLATLSQKTRNDYRHSQIALLNASNYLAEQIHRNADRDVLRFTERVFRFAVTPAGKTVFKKFKLQVEDAIPVDLFTGSSSEKLALFYEKRLPQLQLRLNTRRAPAPEPARSSAPSKKKNGGYTPPL